MFFLLDQKERKPASSRAGVKAIRQLADFSNPRPDSYRDHKTQALLGYGYLMAL